MELIRTGCPSTSIHDRPLVPRPSCLVPRPSTPPISHQVVSSPITASCTCIPNFVRAARLAVWSFPIPPFFSFNFFSSLFSVFRICVPLSSTCDSTALRFILLIAAPRDPFGPLPTLTMCRPARAGRLTRLWTVPVQHGARFKLHCRVAQTCDTLYRQ